MRLHFSLLSAACLTFAIALSGCEETTETNRKAILGDWEIVKGTRNEKETESLAGTTFHFGDDGKMATNLPIGIETPTDYEVEKNTISQIGRQTVKYTIKTFTDTTLTLGLEMRGIAFEMLLRRFTPTVQDSSGFEF